MPHFSMLVLVYITKFEVSQKVMHFISHAIH